MSYHPHMTHFDAKRMAEVERARHLRLWIQALKRRLAAGRRTPPRDAASTAA